MLSSVNGSGVYWCTKLFPFFGAVGAVNQLPAVNSVFYQSDWFTYNYRLWIFAKSKPLLLSMALSVLAVKVT